MLDTPVTAAGTRTLARRLAEMLLSIKARVTIAAIAALIASTTITSLMLVRRAETDTIDASRQRELGEAVHMAADLSRRVVELQRALGATAAGITPAIAGDPARLLPLLAGSAVMREVFSTVWVAGTDGRMRAYADSQGAHAGTTAIGDRPYFRRTLAERRPVVSPPLQGRLRPRKVVIFTFPLSDADGVYGVVGGSLALDSRELLAGVVDTPDDATAAALVVVSDAEGRILAHPDGTHGQRSLADEPRLAAAFRDWVASGSPVEPAGLFLRQPHEVVTAAGVPGADWLVWRVQSEEALLAPLHRARRQALAWATLNVGIGSLAVLGMIAWLLSPLTRLRGRAAHLFDGRYDIDEGWPRPGGEIGALAQVLHEVAAQRVRLERDNGELLARLASVMDAAPLGIVFTRDDRLELVSAELCRLVGLAAADLLGQPVGVLFASKEEFETLRRRARVAFAAGRPYDGECRFRRRDADDFLGRLRGRPIDPAEPDAGSIWTLEDITDHAAARDQLEWQARHDGLTGLHNRKEFDRRVAHVHGAMPASEPAALVVIDLDRFKPINDGSGHAAGDAMLQAVARAIGSRVRASDLVARLGGDEFAVLLERCTPDAAQRIAAAVAAAIDEIALDWHGRVLRIGASVGVAALRAECASPAAWLHEADLACYAAKSTGREPPRLVDDASR
ncbi:MAG: diguanylate cyclase [Burkholderiales bacterium]|nr:diguanylate cyclase [Burkholderiales bacterium]